MKKILLTWISLLAIAGDSLASDALTLAVASPARPEADRQRDAGRKPAEILGFFGIGPGMSVLEVFAGGGYYTQILDLAVTPGGHVLSHNNQAYMAYVGDEYRARLDSPSLENVEPILAEANELRLQETSLDAALLILAYHDFLFGSEEWGWPDVDEQAFIEQLCGAMKPGAVLGIVDHVAAAGGDPAEVAMRLHRIDPERVKNDLIAGCFQFTGESTILRNPEDDHSTSATEGPYQGRTDRFVYRFVRNVD